MRFCCPRNYLPVSTDFGIKVDIHFIFVKHRVFCAQLANTTFIAAIFSSLFRFQTGRVSVALRHTSPAAVTIADG